MSYKHNTETFKKLIESIYKDKYGTDRVQYVSSNSLIELFCHDHGYFSKRANAVQQGKGHCPSCAKISQFEKIRVKALDSFLLRFKKISPHLSFDSSTYVNNTTKVSVTCNKHDIEYQTTPSVLLKGCGCPLCKSEGITSAKTKTQEQFILEAKTLTNNRFDYRLVEYVHGRKPVHIICKKCEGVFKQKPADHLAGSGCTLCMSCGFSESKAAHLYVLTSEEITKVGITNRDVRTRASELSRDNNRTYVLVQKFHFDLGSEAKLVETKTLAWLRERFTKTQKRLAGHTESFIDVDLNQLLNFINSTKGNTND